MSKSLIKDEVNNKALTCWELSILQRHVFQMVWSTQSGFVLCI